MFKGSISSTTYRPTNFFNSPQYFVASTECTVNLNILIFSWDKLKIMTVFSSKKMRISLLPPLLFVSASVTHEL